MRSVIAGNHLGHGIDPGEVIPGEVVARVSESDDPNWPVGIVVRCQGGWQQLSDHAPEALARVPTGLSRPSLALSILGMPGLTAWAGMVDLAKVGEGDVVVIPAAVGGVGAMAAQLSKRAGATTIAITSGSEKRRIALEELGYDHCIDRNEEDLAGALSTIAPEGVSVYFDLVGEPILATVAQRLSIGGRVHHLSNSRGRCAEAGKLGGNEEMHDGLEAAPEAFCQVMRRRNHGKVVVRVGE